MKYWACALVGTSLYVTLLVGQLSERHFVTLHRPAVDVALVAGMLLMLYRIHGLEYGDEDKEVGVLQFIVEIDVLIFSILVVLFNGALVIFMCSDTPAHNEPVALGGTCFDLAMEVVITATLWWCARRKPPA